MKSTGYSSQACSPFFIVLEKLIFSHTFNYTPEFAGMMANNQTFSFLVLIAFSNKSKKAHQVRRTRKS
jgi:hypothetical protein